LNEPICEHLQKSDHGAGNLSFQELIVPKRMTPDEVSNRERISAAGKVDAIYFQAVRPDHV
jgi:hypothetical protein